jgi:hypothetical protein
MAAKKLQHTLASLFDGLGPGRFLTQEVSARGDILSIGM